MEKKTGGIYTGEIIPTKYEMFTIFINKYREEVFITREVYSFL